METLVKVLKVVGKIIGVVGFGIFVIAETFVHCYAFLGFRYLDKIIDNNTTIDDDFNSIFGKTCHGMMAIDKFCDIYRIEEDEKES